MEEKFNEGDVLLYFNDHASYFVILDQFDSEYFTIVANQEGVYEYGFRIKIRYLTEKHFKKIDSKSLRIEGVWERYRIDEHLQPMGEILRF